MNQNMSPPHVLKLSRPLKTTRQSLKDNCDHLAKWAESSALMAWSVSPRMTRIKNTQDNIQSNIASLKIDTSKIKVMMTEIFCAFKRQPFSTPSSSVPKPTLAITEGEKDDMITKELVSKTANVEKESEQEPQDTETIPIIIVKPTVTPSEPEIIRSSSRPQLTDPIVEVQVSQPKSSSHTNPKHDRGKCIARDTDESPRKLVKASTEVRLDSNTQQGRIAGKGCQKSKAIGNKYDFLKKQDAEIKVLNRERLEKLTNEKELRKKRIDQDRWTTSSRRKPETITDIHIHPNTKLVAITVYKGNDKRTFHVYKPFRFGDFGVTEYDELRDIILKKNKVVEDLMNS
ncbi:hypothetical protein Tco_0791176 [Tanacetum coccineum]